MEARLYTHPSPHWIDQRRSAGNGRKPPTPGDEFWTGPHEERAPSGSEHRGSSLETLAAYASRCCARWPERLRDRLETQMAVV